ncbi:MAG: sodium/pantothenate symporter [Rubrobacteraceae bacterium]
MNWDVLIPLVLYLLATFLVAAYLRKYLTTQREGSFQEAFFIGDRSLGSVVLAFTLLASMASAGTFIGAPGVAYDVGFGWALVVMAQIGAAYYVLGILGKKFSIIARKIQAVTMTDLFYARYRSSLVVVGSAAGVILFISAYMVAQFAGGARILQGVTGLPYQVGILIFGTVVIVYTVVGGFRAVAVTDAIQGVLMLLGGVVLWIAFMLRTDGFGAVISELATEQPEMLTLPGPLGLTPMVMFSYFILFGIAAIGLPHAAVRGMAYRDSRSMHRGMMLSLIIMALFSFFFVTLGAAMRVLYPNADAPDAVLPTFIVDSLPGWLAGIVLAAPLAAMMSTVDSLLLVTSGAIVKDVYMNYINRNASDTAVSRLSYLSTLAIGVGVVLVSLTPPAYVQFVVVFALGGLQSMFIAPTVFGLFWKRATKWGAISSMYTGLVCYLVLEIFFPDLFGGIINLVPALVLSVVVMVVVSLLTPKPSREILEMFWGEGKPSEEQTISSSP